jgi:hypothetical protein
MEQHLQSLSVMTPAQTPVSKYLDLRFGHSCRIGLDSMADMTHRRRLSITPCALVNTAACKTGFPSHTWQTLIRDPPWEPLIVKSSIPYNTNNTLESCHLGARKMVSLDRIFSATNCAENLCSGLQPQQGGFGRLRLSYLRLQKSSGLRPTTFE